MNLSEIKQAISNGKTVHWSNSSYVVKESKGDYLIVCTSNNSCIGLTWADGVTLNADEEEFYVNS